MRAGVLAVAATQIISPALAEIIGGRRLCTAAMMWREASAHSRLPRDAAQLVAGGGGRPGPAAGLAVDDAEERPDRHFDPAVKPGSELVEAPVVHAHLAPLTALALADQHRATPRIEVRFSQCHRLADPKSGPPEHDNQGAQPEPVVCRARLAHDRDDLLEVVTIVRDGDSELAIHAMKMRPKYRRLLSGG